MVDVRFIITEELPMQYHAVSIGRCIDLRRSMAHGLILYTWPVEFDLAERSEPSKLQSTLVDR